MAVAVKNKEATSTGMLDRLPVSIALGVIYVLGSLGIIFPLLNYLWWGVLGPDRNSVVWWLCFIGVEVLAAAVLAVLGLRLLGPKPPKGLKAGITLGVVGIFLIALVTQWVGSLVESTLLQSQMAPATAKLVGIVVTGAVGVLLLVVGGRYLLSDKGEGWLGAVADQGWFTTTAYKRSQGVRVRRGTILGILILAGCGIWTLHQSLNRLGGDWLVHVPFTGQVWITPENVGDNPDLKARLAARQAEQPDLEPVVVMDRFRVEDINRRFQQEYVKVISPGLDPNSQQQLEENQVLSRAKFEEIKRQREDERRELEAQGRRAEADLVVPPKEERVVPVTGEPQYLSLMLLPHVNYSLPLLLSLLTLWLTWRLVNVPVFADFLIATEAELNKVSWTTRQRLYQDTIVVLTTVLLMAIFLFAADFAWSRLLTAVGVLRPPPSTSAPEEPKW